MESDEKNIKCGAFSQQKFKNCHLKFFFCENAYYILYISVLEKHKWVKSIKVQVHNIIYSVQTPEKWYTYNKRCLKNYYVGRFIMRNAIMKLSR